MIKIIPLNLPFVWIRVPQQVMSKYDALNEKWELD
jgi:hypothetical protein